MKRSRKLTAVSILALTVAGGLTANPLAAANAENVAPAATKSSPADGPEKTAAAISEHGMAAINDIQLARLAINDGYTDKAADLLQEAENLLNEVDGENEPVTITAEVKVGDKPAKKQTVTRRPDLIPILSEVSVFEALVDTATVDLAPDAAGGAQDDTAAAHNKPLQGERDQAQAASRYSQRLAATEKARKQWRNGDRQGAMETLQLVELGLATRVVSLPLKETGEHLKEAISLLDKGEYHAANLALKAVEDGLVVSTDVIVEPSGQAPVATPAAETEDQKG
jgi:hypothetical protein